MTTAVAPEPETTEPPSSEIDGNVSRSMVKMVGGNVIMIALGVFTGVITARTLAPAGRGEVAAVLSMVMFVSLAGSIGAWTGLSRVQAIRKDAGAEVVGAALFGVIVLGAASIQLGQLVLPLLFREQSPELIDKARILLLLIVPVMLFESSLDLMIGRQQFGRVSFNRLIRPLIHAIGIGALWFVGQISVTTVVVATGLSYFVVGLAAYMSLIRESGIAIPSMVTIRESFSFGSKIFGGLLSQKSNHELDLMLMPALVGAEIIGIYVVAVSAAAIISGGFSHLRQLVFGIVSRGESGNDMEIVEFTGRLTLYAAAAVALGLALTAPLLVNTVYGAEFDGSVVVLRLLIPGVVSLVVAEVLFGALASLDKPLWATSASLIGLFVTVVGIFTLVKPYGASGAAIASTGAYTAMFLVALALTRRLGLSPCRLISPRRFLQDVRTIASAVSGGRPAVALPES